MKNILGSIFFSFIVIQSFAQLPIARASKEYIQDFYSQKKRLKTESLVKNIPFRNVGPSIMSGRIVDIAVNPKNPTHFYAAYASGGLWETKNNGTSFSPIFDNQASLTIGDIAVDWKSNTIWVGTGENNSSRSSYAGTGIYSSSDNGKTWTYKGLPESHHIGRIVIHPNNPNIIWVAALGHLYTANKERGIYKTTDGGRTWKQTLFVNENAGAVDLIIDQNNSDILYTSTWERSRKAWNFTESGTGSGIYKSIDGGQNWSLLNTPESGFPTGEGVGRIGLSIFNNDNETVLYAVLDNQNRRAIDKKTDPNTLNFEALEKMSSSTFLALDAEKISAYLKSNKFPEKYTVESIKTLIREKTIYPKALVDYVKDANKALFDSPVIGAEVYQSTDNGLTWQKMNTDYIDDLYYSYGYYFGQIRVAPNDKNKIYLLGVPILRSKDGGKTIESISKANVHADHHALWSNPNLDGHLINGNDGGINISYDDGEHWIKCNSPAVGQFYAVNVDRAKPYNIYGGLQDNGVWTGPNTYEASSRWHQTGHYPYKELLGGDGMHIEIDNRDNTTVYTGFQFGNYFRINKTTGQRVFIQPKHELGEQKLRFNWQTPIHLSIHNQDILYLGSNKLHRSFQKGEDFKAISDDLTNGGKKGDVAYGTLTSISESPFQFGLIYTGSDDGLVYLTKNGGSSWKKISDDLPQDLWVSRVVASSHNKATVYCSLNAYRNDDFSPYLYRSSDYGEEWVQIGKYLPNEPINVIKEDPKNPNILYVGTDNGLYISFDKGHSFMVLGNLPDAPVHDLVIQPIANDLVVGTHGRSIYVTNISHLQALDATLFAKNAHIFPIEKKRYSKRWGKSWSKWFEAKTPSVNIPIYLKTDSEFDLIVQTEKGKKIFEQSYTRSKGLHYIDYGLLSTKNLSDIEEKKEYYFLVPGTYTISIKLKDGTIETNTLEIFERKNQSKSLPSAEPEEEW